MPSTKSIRLFLVVALIALGIDLFAGYYHAAHGSPEAKMFFGPRMVLMPLFAGAAAVLSVRVRGGNRLNRTDDHHAAVKPDAPTRK